MLKVGLSLAVGFALGYLAMGRNIASAIRHDPEGFKEIIEKDKTRVKAHRAETLRRLREASTRLRHQPFGVGEYTPWNPTRPTGS